MSTKKNQCDDECCVSAEDCHIEAGFGIVSDFEPPRQETLEEAAENYAHNWFDMHETNNYKALKQGFEAGAKWQREQILNFLYFEIIQRRDYSASKMCEEVVNFIKGLDNEKDR